MGSSLPHDAWLEIARPVLVLQQLQELEFGLRARIESDHLRRGDRHGTDHVLRPVMLETEKQVVSADSFQVELVDGFEPRGKCHSAGFEIRDGTAQTLAGYRAKAVEFAAQAMAVDLLENATHGVPT